jgi:DNA-binding transcriptional LysR family regulator
MEVRQLRSFVVVAEHLNFRRAAELLQISQPAVTLQIQALEAEMGVELFKRNRQETALTYAGKVFRDRITTLLVRLDQAAERARRASMGTIGLLRIGFISTPPTVHLLPPIISKFRTAHPQIELSLQNLLTMDQVRMLEDASLDIGFFRMPITPNDQIETILIHKEPLVLLIPAAHPLASERTIQIKDLKSCPFVMYSRKNAPGYQDLVMRTLNNAGFNPIIAQEAGEMYTLASLVSVGIGVALAPISTQQYQLPDIITRRLSWLPPTEIAMGFRRDNVQPSCRVFIDMARQLQSAGCWEQAS